MVSKLGEISNIEAAHKANKERGNSISPVERHALDVITGKIPVTQAERTMCVKYLLELDLQRKKQRMASVNERRKAGKAKEQAEDAPESQVTPELAKRLKQLEGA